MEGFGFAREAEEVAVELDGDFLTKSRGEEGARGDLVSELDRKVEEPWRSWVLGFLEGLDRDTEGVERSRFGDNLAPGHKRLVSATFSLVFGLFMK